MLSYHPLKGQCWHWIIEYFPHEDSYIWDCSLQALFFFPSVIQSLGNLSRGALTDRQQRKEKREQGPQPWEQRRSRGRRAVLGVPWVPAGIFHPPPAPLAARYCYWSCRGKRKPEPWACAPQISQLHLPGKQNTAKCPRLLIALIQALLVCLGHSDIWGGSGFKKPRYSPLLLRSAEGFPWADNT